MLGFGGIFFRALLKVASLPGFAALFLAAFPIFIPPEGCAFAQPAEPLKVITTLFPLQEFARAVGGDRIQAELLLPPGAEAHNWEPRPSDIAKIARADVFIFIGPMMEPWAAKVLKAVNNPKLSVMEAGRGLDLIEARESESGPKHPHRAPAERHADPHFWLDFSLDEKVVEAIAGVFALRDNTRASYYRERAEAYKERLAAMDAAYQKILASCGRREIIIGGHSAFAYLAARYSLEQVALYGVSPNAEPTPRKLVGVIETARRHGAKYIFFEAFVNPKLAKVLAQEAGLGTLILSAGHNLTRDQLRKNVGFLDLMEQNLENLSRGLDCHGK